jgi:hypothetical protein
VQETAGGSDDPLGDDQQRELDALEEGLLCGSESDWREMDWREMDPEDAEEYFRMRYWDDQLSESGWDE